MKKVGLLALALYCGIIYTACGKEDTVYFEPDTQMESEEVTEAVLCPPASCYVYVCGEVVHPGVYEVAEGARVCNVLELAGGLKDAAAKEALNQAEPVVDGQMIKVPDQETYLLQQTGSADSAAEPEDGRINLNTASKEQLMTLSGIGESKAETIISYREKNGAFQTIEDLMNIPGIKNGVFEKIKDNIRVN